MAANAKIIKRRIRSIGNTRKITKAMELVAASKMRRAMTAVSRARPFARLAWNTVNAISRSVDEEMTHPLLQAPRAADKSLLLLFTSDRGLAGPFNNSIIKHTLAQLPDIEENIEAIAIGRRGNSALARQNIPVIGSFEGLSNKPTFRDIVPLTKLVLDAYQKRKYKHVYIAYTDFKSALRQEPAWTQLLPLGAAVKQLSTETDTDADQNNASISKTAVDYTFEPSTDAVLNQTLPRIVETTLYQALLESSASEHAARMMAMRNATDNAGDMLTELKMTYNRIRQASITQEISEISAGKAALQ